MTEYKPTEYVVDFGDCRSNQFVRLNMALIEHNGAKLHDRIVRCMDCKHYTYADKEHGNDDWCGKHEHIAWSVNGFCAWGVKRKEGGDD